MTIENGAFFLFKKSLRILDTFVNQPTSQIDAKFRCSLIFRRYMINELNKDAMLLNTR